MNIMKKNISYMMFFLFFFSCTTKGDNHTILTKDGVIPIDLVNNLDQVTAKHLLSDVIENIDIIPLEITDSSLLKDNTNDIKVDKDNIFIYDYKAVYRFDYSGKFLNRIGNKGNGPGEYLSVSNLQIDSEERLLYFYDYIKGIIMQYNYDGNFVTNHCEKMNENISGTAPKIVLTNKKIFMVNKLPALYEKTNYWTFALLDNEFSIKKSYINPDFIGKEEAITLNKGLHIGWKNYWSENFPCMSFYSNDFVMSFWKGDTIYEYNETSEIFLPKYSILLGKQPTFEESHKWIKDNKYFTYLSLYSFYLTKDYIYFQLAQDDMIYIAKYNKSTGEISSMRTKTVIKEQALPGSPGFVYKRVELSFPFENDLCGGPFNLEYEASGEHWVSVIYPSDSESLIEKIKNYTVKNEALKNKYLKILSNLREDDNPILLVATLK